MLVDENGNPIAQGTDTAPGAGQDEAQKSGFEQRIAELTAKMREAERGQSELREQNMVLLQTLATGSQVQTPAAPAVEIDPERVKEMDAYVTPKVRQLEQMLARVEGALMQSEFQRAAQGVDPEIAREAEKLQANWRKQGFTGWTPQDALVYAAGAQALKQSPQQQANAQRAQFNALQGGIQQGQGALPSHAPTQKRNLPTNIDELPLHAQLALYEKELGDEPI